MWFGKGLQDDILFCLEAQEIFCVKIRMKKHKICLVYILRDNCSGRLGQFSFWLCKNHTNPELLQKKNLIHYTPVGSVMMW